MTPLQLELTRLIGKKELTFGCLLDDGEGSQAIYLGKSKEFPNAVWKIKKQEYGANNYMHRYIIGHPATLSDFHRFIGSEGFTQHMGYIKLQGKWSGTELKYDVMREFLDQDETVIEGILSFIKENQ